MTAHPEPRPLEVVEADRALADWMIRRGLDETYRPNVERLIARHRLAAVEAAMEAAMQAVDAERDYRRHCETAAKARGAKQEARDFQTMAIACSHVADAIRATPTRKGPAQ